MWMVTCSTRMESASLGNDDTFPGEEPFHRLIILIGPMGAGKSTIARMIAQTLGIEHIELDNLRWGYYHEIGYDEAHAQKRQSEEGFLSMYHYWKPFKISSCSCPVRTSDKRRKY
jgi:adenylylsulfate kinase-like enzyme